ncbi:unnamed protein product [Lepeophtheirus salmonis]|uniref:(salmon louse) hypothetical protein n=1 Tax=Lepeophtheirus salmonis TaxID=72036 RepID=A0A7R8HC51_LEPSM|nr:unnamed protein product [Lepeophtheirus salmonis]CAF3000016.1 unnamed protein product [Lepeophtheirus salmonis]
MLPIVQDVAVHSHSFLPSFLISLFSKVFETSFAFLRRTFVILGRMTPTFLSRRLQPIKDWIRHRILETDSLAQTLVLGLTSRYPILTERLSVVVGALRERSTEFFAQSRNNLGTNPLGRFSLKIIEWVLRIVERPFVPFSGVVEISEINTDIPKDTNDAKKNQKLLSSSRISFIYSRGLRKSIFHTIRIGELKVNQMEEDFVSLKGSLTSSKNHHFNIIFDGLKHLLVALKLTSEDRGVTYQCVNEGRGVKSLPLSPFKTKEVDTKVKPATVKEKPVGTPPTPPPPPPLPREMISPKLGETSSLN